jgi:hypothetical protein
MLIGFRQLSRQIWYPGPSDPAFGSGWQNLTRFNQLFVPSGDPGERFLCGFAVLRDLLSKVLANLVALTNAGLAQPTSNAASRCTACALLANRSACVRACVLQATSAPPTFSLPLERTLRI